MKRLLAVFTIMLMAATAQAVTVSPSPAPKIQFMNAAGTGPCSGCRVYTYEPFSTTAKATYTDYTGTTQNTLPYITLDAAGRGNIWINGCVKYIVKSSADVLLYTTDNMCELATAAAASATVSQWQSSGYTPTQISGTSFSAVGDKTAVLEPGLRLQTSNTGGTIYSTIAASSYGGGITTVTVVNDSGSLDSGLSVVNYSLLTVSNPALPLPPVVTKTSGYTILPADCGKTFIANITSAATFTLPSASAVYSGCPIISKNTSTYTLTIAGTVDGFSSLTVPQYGQPTVWSDGTSWHVDHQTILDQTGALRSASTVTAPNVAVVTGPTGTIDPAFVPSILYPSDFMGISDVVVSGLTGTTSANLTMTITGGTAYIGGTRVVVPSLYSGLTFTYTASKDTYVDLLSAGTLTYLAVANGAAAPATAASSIRLGKAVTNGSTVTSWASSIGIGYTGSNFAPIMRYMQQTGLLSTSQVASLGTFPVTAGDVFILTGLVRQATADAVTTIDNTGTSTIDIMGTASSTSVTVPTPTASVSFPYCLFIRVTVSGTLIMRSSLGGSSPYVNDMTLIFLLHQNTAATP